MTERTRFQIVAAVTFVLFILISEPLIMGLVNFRNAWRRSDALNNLKHVGIVFNMYGLDSPEGVFPPPTPRGPHAVPDLVVLKPCDGMFLSCLLVPWWNGDYAALDEAETDWPKNAAAAEAIAAENYVYFGYAFSTESELNALLDSIPRLCSQYPQPIERPDNPPILALGEALRKSQENPASVDASKTVVLFENPRLNAEFEDAVNVLYLDGSARTVTRDEFFPNAHFDRLPSDLANRY